MESTESRSTEPASSVSMVIEHRRVYGCGETEVTGMVSNGTLYLRQDANDHDHHAQVQVATLAGIRQLEQLLSEAKQQLRTSHKKQAR